MKPINFYGTELKANISKKEKTIVLVGTGQKPDFKNRCYLSMSDIEKGYRGYEVKIKM